MGQGDPEFVTFMLQTFVESCEEARLGLAQGLAEGNMERLKTTAHTLKPNLVHLRAGHMVAPVEALDRWEGGFEDEALRPLVAAIDQLLAEVMTQIVHDLRASAA